MNHPKIVIAEDDFDDQELIKMAFQKIGFKDPLKFVADGQDLMDHLENTRPSIIFLDLNMPRKDGRQALKEIKEHNDLKKIPVIIFTTSKSKEDIDKTYASGANCFITKPTTFSDLVDAIRTAMEFWLKTATLPSVA